MTIDQLTLQALLEACPKLKCQHIDAIHSVLSKTNKQDLASLVQSHHAIECPGIPKNPALVHPRELSRRGVGTTKGRIGLLHAIAHIEFNAMNLALDAALRFVGLPEEYYRDWLQVAIDESRHFQLLNNRLNELGAEYGDLPAHQGLWDMALRTAHDPLDRMAMVPRIMEARGLDVTPGMIQQFTRVDDIASAELLTTILAEEVAHVEAGNRWFRYICQQRQLSPEQAWFGLVRQYLGKDIRCPLNIPARRQSGFNDIELDWLQQACR